MSEVLVGAGQTLKQQWKEMGIARGKEPLGGAIILLLIYLFLEYKHVIPDF